MMKKKPLIILTGPTAVGKSNLSIALAKKINGAIISADSMQVYRYMDIGSAKIKKEEMDGVPHYLIDEFMPKDEFNVTIFQKYAKKYMEEIYALGKIPILVGGTGFYIQSVLYDIDFSQEDKQDDYRKELECIAKESGAHTLHEMLHKVDPQAAAAIHENNIKRVIRALEFYHETGTKISEHNEKEREKESPYNFCYFVLNDDRNVIYQKIDTRIDQMLEDGLLEEVKALQAMGCHRGMVSMQGLGYKEILAYLEGEMTLEEAVYILKRDTRHFAKRQLTWFRREKDVTWMNKQEFPSEEEMLQQMLEEMRKKGIRYNECQYDAATI